jgi:hypothetical protein
MFGKSKSEITFKEFQHKLNILHNFENDWGHFCDPEDDNNNIFYNNLYQSIKEIKEEKVKEKEEKVKEKEEKVKEEKVKEKEIEKEKEEKVKRRKIEEAIIDIKKLNQNGIPYNRENKNNEYEYEYENEDTKKYIIDTVFNCISVIFITFVSFKIHHLTGIN